MCFVPSKSPGRHTGHVALAVYLVAACGPAVAEVPTADTSGAATSSSDGDSESISGTGLPTATTPATLATAATGTSTEGSTGTPSSSTGTTGGICDPFAAPDCGGSIFQCADGEDNDGDGLVDLADGECLSPCDDDEAVYAFNQPTAAPGCPADCAFDGNTGDADDGCEFNFRCDPSNLEVLGCDYNPALPCDFDATAACRQFCEPYTPNGCDCWGCCSVRVDGKEWTVQIEDPFCSSANVAACAACTQRMDQCGNPCDAEACEICFGETEPRPGCERPTCEAGSQPCADYCDCDDGGYCLQGCCHPPPP